MKSVQHGPDLRQRCFHTRGSGFGDPYRLCHNKDRQPAMQAVSGETAKILAR